MSEMPDGLRPWYHGSPLRLTSLRAGSTVTQDADLARVFSHRPSLVSTEDDGSLRHDGRLPGYLYVVAEQVGDSDVAPHPRSTMPPGKEWLTTRALRLEMVGQTQVRPGEALTRREARSLRALSRRSGG